MLVALAANAKDYNLKVGVNEVEMYSAAKCTFTATEDCKVLLEIQEVYDVTLNGQAVQYGYVSGSGYPFQYEMKDVKSGDKIVASNPFTMANRIRVSVFAAGGSIPVSVNAITPKEGTVFSWSYTGLVSINFNKTVFLKSIKMIAAGEEYDVDDVHVGNSVGFNLTNPLNAVLNAGKLQPGEKFKVRISGLCEANDRQNLYNGDGIMEIEYIAPYPQYELVSSKVGGTQLSYTHANDYTFLSFFPKDGEDGLFEFEFGGEISKVGSVIMTMGNLDLDTSGKYHRSALPYTIEGNKLIVDARGKLRTLAILFPALNSADEGEEGAGESMLGEFDTSHLTITLSNVLDLHGNAFHSVNSGSVGSYSFVMNYKEIIEEAYIDGDNKAEGESVNGGETIRLWLSNPDIKFESIKVTYFVEVPAAEDQPEDVATELEAKFVSIKDFTITPDPLEGEVIEFTLPEMANAYVGSTVRVALDEASSADGMPHYLYIEFKASGVADAIEGVAAGASTAGTYRLSGVKVNERANGGLYIIDGKKKYIK